MAVNDIRPLKKELRRKYRSIREGMKPEEKAGYDFEIFTRLTALPFYTSAKALLCFVSTPIEVDTRRLIVQALADGKKVAVPKCLDRQGNMDFYRISGLGELAPGEFALLEPDARTDSLFREYKQSICILPAFAFDHEGFRLGFGMGYYDRFLHRYTGQKVGVCYNSCIAPSLPHGRFDVPADYIVTQKYTLTIRKASAEDEGDQE